VASSSSRLNPANWWSEGLRFYPWSLYLRRRFGCRVRRVVVDAGFGCPNRDGSLNSAGCIFCDPAAFSPARRSARLPLSEQIARGIEAARTRFRAEKVIVYFQPGTNTYAPIERLRKCFETALEPPEVVGLAVGTRPDCLGGEVLELAAELARRTWFCLELGLQSAHDRSLRWIGRGHDEGPDEVAYTARQLARLGVHGVKIHNLYAVKNTPLAELVARGEVRLPTLAEHVELVVRFLEELPPECVVDRLSGDAPSQYLIGPEWCLNRAAVRAAVEAELRRRDTRQGAALMARRERGSCQTPEDS